MEGSESNKFCRMKRKPEKPRLTQDQVLSACPIRLVTSDVQPRDGGGGAIKVPLAPRRWPFRLPPGATKTFELDAVGVFVWNTLDGQTTVRELVERLAGHYHLNLREAQVPTLKFLEMLMRKGLVGMPVASASEAAVV